jgi:hypothetical protein
VIPVTRDKNNFKVQFRILSLPTLLSTLWCLIPLTYFLYASINWQASNLKASSANLSIANSSKAASASTNLQMDLYIALVFKFANFLLIFHLPSVLGYFIGNNK